MTAKNKALLGTPPETMKIAEFLDGGFRIEDIPGEYLVGVAPHGMNEPVEVDGEESALPDLGYFYDVELRSYGICSRNNWVLATRNGSVATGIETVRYGESESDWEVFIIQKPSHKCYTDYLPAFEMGRGAVADMLKSVGAYSEFSVYIGTTADQLLEREVMYDSDAEGNRFCRSSDYSGNPSGLGLLADAMDSDAAFDKLAPLIWFDADTIRRHAPKFYHAQEPALSVGDYALTKLSMIVRIVAVDADSVKTVPASQSDDHLVTTYTKDDSLMKLDGELVEQLLDPAKKNESEVA